MKNNWGKVKDIGDKENYSLNPSGYFGIKNKEANELVTNCDRFDKLIKMYILAHYLIKEFQSQKRSEYIISDRMLWD